ncbi:hypothetical protein [Thioalkalivibrio sp. ALR17-21]|uniref:hypothetical protein n=1 Tax=Thioalkalivibrio sp. ALR17-21 TaxID=1269813 RepID=UPI00040168FE|nr:hypothetical protein [Thioalkalivibrio sp. ALR17-21]
MSDAVDKLRRMVAAVQASRPLPDDVRAWWLHGAERFMDSGGRSPLDTCLGLRGRGVRSLETQQALAERNEALERAGKLAGADLPEEVRRFRRRWARLWTYEQPPSDLRPVERELFQAFRSHDVPEDPHYLRRLARVK